MGIITSARGDQRVPSYPSYSLSRDELLQQTGITAKDLAWYQEHFQSQMRLLSQVTGDGERFAADAVLLLRGLSAMRSQGATAEQIKSWFGL